jgi:hypothetical protein
MTQSWQMHNKNGEPITCCLKKVVAKKVYHAVNVERKLKKNPDKKRVERIEMSSASRLQMKQRKIAKKDTRHPAIIE